MKILQFAFAFFCAASIFSQKSELYFTVKPTLTPDASTVIFSYQSDLWKVSSNGGEATRMTAMDGTETDPAVSPDGKWLAFTSNQYGNNDIYLMPIAGGEIKQLTHHQSNDMTPSWNWDSKTINFVSNRYNSMTNYTVSIKGDTPKRTFPHYFNTVHNVVQHPQTKALFFNESWESSRFAHRKRYKGDYNPDLKSYNFKTKAFTKHTTYRGKDFGATIDKNGNVYYMSDQFNDEYNLYLLQNGSPVRLTNFKTSIFWPKVSANGQKVVFRRDYQIHVYDIAKKSTKKLKIDFPNNSTLEKNLSYNTKGKVTAFDVASDGKKMAFVSRGRLFVSDVEGKFIKEVKTINNEAVGEVKWLKGDTSLLFSQSDKGYYNWYTIDLQNAKTQRRTKVTQNDRLITFNKDKSKGVFLRGRNEIHIIDLKTFKSELIVKDELWGFYNFSPSFSPDGKFVLFNAYRDFEADIFVYNLQTKQKMNLTNTKVSEFKPQWSADGKYIYFNSERTAPNFPSGGNGNTKVYQMALDKYQKPFKMDKVNALFAKKDTAKKKEKEKVVVKINPNGLMDRLTRISPRFGDQAGQTVIQNGTKTHVIYVSNHDEGNFKLWMTTMEPFKPNKTVKLGDGRIGGYQYVHAKKKHYILANGTIHSLNVGAKKLKPINTSHNFQKNLSEEFEQMYYEAWAGMEINFYDEKFHGQDWKKLRDRYAKFLPYVTDRSQLRLILNDMLGELNTSHFGFYSNGREERIYYGTTTMATGIIFDNENPYVVHRIVKESPVDVSSIKLRRGDRLVAVNGTPVNEKMNRESYFAGPSFDREMQLTFSRNGKTFDVNIHTTLYWSISTLLYDEWQDENQAYVDQKSNNQIAYFHMKNMGGGELTKFYHDLMSDEAYKKGLILDLRYNTGGNVHDAVLRFLQQKEYLQWKYREGKLTGQSNFNYGNKPIVLLINEQSLSDAEMTAAGFKELGLGTIVGTETYRWIIFTTGNGLVDGSFYRLPSWGCYTLDGKDLELTGVAPDVYVGKNFKDRLEKNTPQLDKAIEIIMNKLK
ncbi:MAG: peptidase S41 [Flavobacteriaceae bacterium]|nr:peptidase S41 [Flavobacteriaceae bacterium]|tara:strand:+ start:514390 stop:517506 length:3117 start_codon:yes stop_codon:yes gene_type:complete